MLRATVICLLMLLLLPGCQPQKPMPGMRPAAQQPVVQPDPERERALRLERLLWLGDEALRRGRLLRPDYDNAHDYFSEALLLDPDNAQARSGLQAVLLYYLDLARSAAAQSHFGEALRLLDLARPLDPDDLLVSDAITHYRQARADAQRQREAASGDLLLRIDPGRLTRREDSLAEELAALAQQVREQDLMILIIARNDTEGRWIYQKMREGVPGYLLRGDIMPGAAPAVHRFGSSGSEQ